MAEPLLMSSKIHPTRIVQAYVKALESSIQHCEKIARPFDLGNKDELVAVIRSCVGTKTMGPWGEIIVQMAVEAVGIVTVETTAANGLTMRKEIDIKRYARIEKLPGGERSDCRVVRGVVLNKDVTHPKMRRRIEKPRILLLDCPLEYKKGESQTTVEPTTAEDFDLLLRQEEEHVYRMCADIISHKPDLVFTEKGVSDLAQHYLYKAGITAIRRLRKSDNNRLARAVGATIVSRTSEIQESDIGSDCGLFEVRKIGDEYFVFIEDCKAPKACTIMLRGGSRDVLNEVERNLTDAMQVTRNIAVDPRILPGGGATEMALAQHLMEESKFATGVQEYPYRAAGIALEVIPRTLAENCGADIIKVMTELRALHAKGANPTFGIDGETGTIVDMATAGNSAIWDPYSVKVQAIKTAIESACMLLRVDDIVSGLGAKKQGQ